MLFWYNTLMSKQKHSARAEKFGITQFRVPVLRVARKRGVRNVRVFGSFARGEQTKSSDLDLLVNMPRGSTLFDLAGLKIDLEATLKIKVDVIPDDSIKPALRKRILSDALTL